MKRLVSTLLALTLLPLAACLAISGQVPCAKNADCDEPGHACDFEDGFCKPADDIVRRADAGRADAAGGADAVTMDAGGGDAAEPRDAYVASDAARADAVSLDTSASDSAQADALLPDAAAGDVAVADVAAADVEAVDAARGADRVSADAHNRADATDLDDRNFAGCDGHSDEDAGCVACTEHGHCNDDNPCTRDLCNQQHLCVYEELHGERADGGCNLTEAFDQSCVHGVCVDSCEDESDCSGRACYQALGYCRQCFTGSDCATGSCLDGVCRRP